MTTDLFSAIEAHDLNALVSLLHGGSDPNDLNARAHTPLHAAIFEVDFGGSEELVEVLINMGADVNRVDLSAGTSPLISALLEDKPAIVKMLLEHGANPNFVDQFGEAPLRICAERDDLEMVKVLLAHGATATINMAGGILGHTALGHAAVNLNVLIVKALLSAGANPRALDIDHQLAHDHLPPCDDKNAPSWHAIDKLLRT